MKTQVFIALAAACLVACTPSSSMKKLIAENVANAEVQVSSLLAASEADGVVKIPSTYKDGSIRFVPKDDWVSGFFAGTLWYMYELTGDEMWADHAIAHTNNISEIQHLTWHHDVGFMVYDSFGNGMRLKNVPGYDDVILTTAKSLSTRFRPAAGVLQSWNVDRGWQAERGWQCPVIIDNMMNLELLFKASEMSGDSTYFNIAVSHADKTLANHFRDNASCWHVVDYDTETGEVRGKYTAQGYSDDSAWARGQAWALYGYMIAYRFTGYERYLEQSKKVAEFVFNNPNMPADKVPYWDYDAPNIPDECKDVSSAAIMASALYELCSVTGDKSYMETADTIIRSLSTPAYRAEQGTNGGFILMHSVGSIPHGSNIDVPLNYADYYFLEALIRRKNLL